MTHVPGPDRPATDSGGEDYAEVMEDLARRRFDELFEGVHDVVLVDFPDHPNVGDSAIALGELAYFAARDIRVRAVHCIGTMRRSVLRSSAPVVIHGGGNIAGFFRQIDDHRLRVVRGLRPSTLLVQAPQSVHFVTPTARQEFLTAFGARPGLRMGVRDASALADLSQVLPHVRLAPDAVHLLGRIEAPEPRQDVVVLARQDRESDQSGQAPAGVDWLRDEPALRRSTWWRWKARFVGPAGALLNPSVSRWSRIAAQRLSRGVSVLADGEVVVTDRLHAMLLALQMGRRVVAIDNNNHKLSKYAGTWFGSTRPRVTFAPDFDAALEIARTG